MKQPICHKVKCSCGFSTRLEQNCIRFSQKRIPQEKTDMRGISFKLQYKEFRLGKEFPENKVPDIEVIC